MEHTPKNILIRAVKKGAAEKQQGENLQPAAKKREETGRQETEMEQAAEEDKGIGEGYRRVMEFLHVSPMLAVLQDRKEEKQNA